MNTSEQVIGAVRGPGTTLQLADLLARTFWPAVMLTGDSESAEDVVRESISSLDVEDLTTECLLHCVLNLSMLTSQGLSATAVVTDSIVTSIPAELRRVLELKTTSRHCFVLRVLLRLPVYECARLLQRSEDSIADLTCLAASELAAFELTNDNFPTSKKTCVN